ncbi:hypothetical protein ACGFX2_38555 [Streptomyces goshikiensis]|uniref:hypothetical protein n=1 Tax=Streptomyces goshikiensis TaxID=1942 RepID=UPI00371F86B2
MAEDITRRKVRRAKFEQGDFNSIAPDEAVRRLRDILGVEIPTEAATNLDALHKKRNALQHYGLNATQEDIEPVAAKVLDFLIAFLDETLLPALDPAVRARAENDMTYVRRGLHLIQSFVAARLERLAPELAGLEDRTVQCTRCFQDTLVAGDGEAPDTARCRFCHVAFAPEVIAAEYVGVHNAGMFASGATEVCTKCGGTEAVVRHVIRVCEIRMVPGTLRPVLDEPAEARWRVPLSSRCAGPRHAGHLGHALLGLGLPAGDQDPQPQAFRAPVQIQEVEQAVGIHDRDAVQVHQEVPLAGGNTTSDSWSAVPVSSSSSPLELSRTEPPQY